MVPCETIALAVEAAELRVDGGRAEGQENIELDINETHKDTYKNWIKEVIDADNVKMSAEEREQRRDLRTILWLRAAVFVLYLRTAPDISGIEDSEVGSRLVQLF